MDTNSGGLPPTDPHGYFTLTKALLVITAFALILGALAIIAKLTD